MARQNIVKVKGLPGTYRLVRPTTDGKTHVILGEVKDPRREGVTVPFERQVEARSDADAYRQREELIEQIRASGHATPPTGATTTLGALTKSWLSLHGSTVDPGTLERYRFELKLILGAADEKKALGPLFTLEMTAQDVQEWVNRKIGDGYSKSTIEGCLRTFRLLVRKNLRHFSPGFRDDLFVALVVKVSNSAKADEAVEDYTPTKERVADFLAIARKMYPLFYLWFDWKVRWGVRGTHLTPLRKDDVDREGMFVRMRRKVVRGRVGAVTDHKPVRSKLPMTRQMLADYDAHVVMLLRSQSPGFAADGLLFPGRRLRDGSFKPMRDTALVKAWRTCCLATWVGEEGPVIGIDPDRWKPHGARGSFYDVLRGKVGDDKARAVTAHTRQMKKHYETLTLEDAREVVEVMEEALDLDRSLDANPENTKAG